MDIEPEIEPQAASPEIEPQAASPEPTSPEEQKKPDSVPTTYPDPAHHLSYISSIKFTPLTPVDIERLSEVTISEHQLYDEQHRPTVNGLLDPRLGVSGRKETCQTCHQDLIKCPGHFGVIPLTLPVFHPGHFKTVHRILQCVCFNCGHVRLEADETALWIARFTRFRALDEKKKCESIFEAAHKAALKQKVCTYCGFYQTLIRIRAPYRLLATNAAPQSQTYELDPKQAYDILSRIPKSEVMFFDMENHPVDLMMTHVVVPPKCIRPTVPVPATGQTNEDDLTMILNSILGYSERLAKELEKGVTSNENWQMLQRQCAQLIEGSPEKSDSQRRGMAQRLKGKHGRFRGNLSGKRVDFSARSVISPDPNIGVHEVGVPMYVAKQLTIPELVTKFNLRRLRNLAWQGPRWPGAVSVTTPTGDKFLLKHVAEAAERAKKVKIGGIVERHLANGDPVLFNRQPSLHRVSIMCHLVRVLHGKTFRLNLCACTPYNADFDGDEMNLHVPQTIEARAEAMVLMAVQHNLTTPRLGNPIIAGIQDFITAAYLLTEKQQFFNHSQFCQFVAPIYSSEPAQKEGLRFRIPKPAIMKPFRLWTGKQLFSAILMPYETGKEEGDLVPLTFETHSRAYNAKTPEDRIKAELLDQVVVFRGGELLAGRLDKNTVGGGSSSSIFAGILQMHGGDAAVRVMNRMCVVLSRFLAEKGFSIGIDDVTPPPSLEQAKFALLQEVQEKITKDLDKDLGDDADAESLIRNHLNALRSTIGDECTKHLDEHNTALIMAKCGSKGSTLNISQMVACVGQQMVGGSRVPFGFVGRALPHFLPGDSHPASRGFVSSSFYSGLDATEFFFHTMAGREGLVDTAVKTSETGYMQRRLMKAMEDLTVQYDHTVRDAVGNVIQFVYGGDFFDPSRVEKKETGVHLPRLFYSLEYTNKPLPGEEPVLPDDLEAWLVEKCGDSFQEVVARGEDPLQFPSPKKPLARASMRLGQAFYDFILELAHKQPLYISILEAFHLAVMRRAQTMMIEPGSAVGAMGAQSIGEPGTQMTLRTFHFAGVASMNITLGVPRIREIINATKEISTPIIRVRCQDPTKAVVSQIRYRLRPVLLEHVVDCVAFSWGPDPLGPSSILQIEVILSPKRIADLHLSAQDVNPRSVIKAIRMQKPFSDMVLERDGDYVVKIMPDYAKWKSKDGAQFTSDDSGGELHSLMNQAMAKVKKVQVFGMKGVTKAVLQERKGRDGEFEIVLDGTCLLQVMGHPEVLDMDTETNDVLVTEAVLGIEAAHAKIISEVQFVMEEYGIHLDARHVTLLADLMTSKGKVYGIQRFGIAQMKTSTLMLASFEKTVEHLLNAAAHQRQDFIRGVSESIILGQQAPVGTGMVDVYTEQALEEEEIKRASVDLNVERLLGVKNRGFMVRFEGERLF